MLQRGVHHKVRAKTETKSCLTISVLLLPKFENTSGLRWYLDLMVILYTGLSIVYRLYNQLTYF